MARDDLHFRLRISEDLKKKIGAAAAANDRSMTAEITARLEMSFLLGDGDDQLAPDDLDLADVFADFERMKQKLVRLLRTSSRQIGE
jgi:hypothetical protein